MPIKKKIFNKNKYQNKKSNVDSGGFWIALFTLSVPLAFLQLIVVLSSPVIVQELHPTCGHLDIIEPTRVQYIPITAYSSTVDQTDSTPFITANGTYVHWGVAAANFLPFETCIRIPEIFGDQYFVIHDRKHKRFSSSIDLWFPTRQEALNFGKRTLQVEIWQ